MDVEKLKKMAGTVRTGGKGSMRRKKKCFHKAIPVDDKRLQSTLKRFHVNTMAGIDEVIIFKDNVVVHFETPKVQAYPPDNTWVVSGTAQTKRLADILAPEYQQMGSENRDRSSNQYQRQAPARARATLTPLEEDSDDDVDEDSDDDVPGLVGGETFEDASERDFFY